MTGARAVACGIGHARGDGVVRFAQRRDVCCRYRHAPVAAGVSRGRVVNAIQGHDDRGAVRLVAGAGELQIFAFLDGIDHIIARNGIDSDNRSGQGNRNLMRLRGAVARFVGEGRRHRMVAIAQRARVSRRNTHTPVAGRVQHCAVIFTVQRHGDHVACLCPGDCARNDQRLTVFSNIQNVITGNGVEGDLRHGGVHQHRRIRAGRVTGFIRHGRRNDGSAVGDTGQIGCRHVKRPAAVSLYLCGVLIAIKGHRDRLPRFGSRGAAQGEILCRLCRIEHVVVTDRIDGDRRRSGIDAEFV